MRTLIRFELKKLVLNPLAAITNLVVLLLMTTIVFMNVSSSSDLKQIDDNSIAHVGVITDSTVKTDISNVQNALKDPQKLKEWPNDGYIEYIIAPWRNPGQSLEETVNIATTSTNGFYQQNKDNVLTILQSTEYEKQVFTQNEKDFWTKKIESVPTPWTFGPGYGWKSVLDLLGFLIFPLVAIILTLSSLFSREYKNHTDAVILTTKNGKTSLIKAKVIAGLVYTILYQALATTILVGGVLGLYSTRGANLPLQRYFPKSPYSLTLQQATLIALLVIFVMTLGVAGLTMAFSARLKSPLATVTLINALLWLPIMVPSNSFLLSKIKGLTFDGVTSGGMMFRSFISFDIFGLVLDLLTVLTILYSAITVISITSSAIIFRKHQVS